MTDNVSGLDRPARRWLKRAGITTGLTPLEEAARRLHERLAERLLKKSYAEPVTRNRDNDR